MLLAQDLVIGRSLPSESSSAEPLYRKYQHGISGGRSQVNMSSTPERQSVLPPTPQIAAVHVILNTIIM